MATVRTAAGQKLLFTLDGVGCGIVDAVDGGGIVADVAEVKDGTAPGVTHKVITSFVYEPLTIDTGLGLAHEVYDWIAATWSGAFPRKDCSITGVDAQLNATWQEQCRNALLTGVAFGALDAASKDPVRLSLTITPEVVQDAPASGKAPAAAKQAKALAANFRLELDGVDCTGVRRIDPFTVQLLVTRDATGGLREPQVVPTRVDFPSLVITLADNAAASSWRTWAEEFIVNGDHSGAKEKSGAIVLLGPDMKTELARVELHGVGLCALQRSKRAASADAVATVVADVFCEAMTLQVGAPAPAPAPKPEPIPLPHRPVTPIR